MKNIKIRQIHTLIDAKENNIFSFFFLNLSVFIFDDERII